MQVMTPLETTSLASSTQNPENFVVETLRGQIESGNFKAGDWLPTERKLAQDLHVERHAVRMAINRLVKSGLVIRRPHCRPIVAGAEEQPIAGVVSKQPVPAAASFIALMMWRGGGQLERTLTAQQRIFWGMNQALAEAGHHAVFLDMGAVGSEEENAAREAEHLRYVLNQGFGGAVFYPYAYRSNQALIEEVCRAIPFVAIDRRCVSVETDFVGIENYRAMYDAAMHLIGLGHRRIAYVTKNEQITAVQDRIQGYLDAMRDADLEDMVLLIPERRLKEEWTVIETIFLLPKEKRPTAAVAYNDYSAVYLASRLENIGLSVPGDVAVTGFDDIVPALPSGAGLTTVAQPYEEIGKKAVELILRRLKDPAAPPLSAFLPAPLIVRESSSDFRQDLSEPPACKEQPWQ